MLHHRLSMLSVRVVLGDTGMRTKLGPCISHLLLRNK